MSGLISKLQKHLSNTFNNFYIEIKFYVPSQKVLTLDFHSSLSKFIHIIYIEFKNRMFKINFICRISLVLVFFYYSDRLHQNQYRHIEKCKEGERI